LVGSLEPVLAAIGSFFAIFALTYFFSGSTVGVNIGLVVVEVALEVVILGVEVVVEVVVKVVVGLWLWLGAGVAISVVVLIGLPSIGLLLSPIKKGAYIRNGLIISIRL
jgi:hypothetical protein